MNISLRNKYFISLLILVFILIAFLTCHKAFAFYKIDKEHNTIRIKSENFNGILKIKKDKSNDLLVPLDDINTSNFINSFKGKTTYLVPLDTIVFSFPQGPDYRLKLKEKDMVSNNKKIPLEAAPILIEGKPYIPFETLQRVCGVKSLIDPNNNSYYLDTLITDIELKEDKKSITLKINTRRPLKYKTETLSNPKRYAIEIEGAILDKSLSDKDISHEKIGSLFISQESFNPNRVKIVIPIKQGTSIILDKNKSNKGIIAAKIFPSEKSFSSGFYKKQRITDLRIKELDDRVLFQILTTGPIKYEWRRLLPPDNRFFVDIPNAIYTAPPYYKEFNVGYLKSIKVVQLNPLPNPIVRITADLHVPSKISVGPNMRYPGILQLSVLSHTINPQRVSRQGFGVSEEEPSLSARGMVIVIDPGHGGGDPGACNRAYGLKEKNITLDISLRLAKLLRKSGCKCILTRYVDRDVTYAGSPDALELQSRVDIANKARANIFISIHIDACRNSHVNGASVYYNKKDSSFLAQKICDSLTQSNGLKNKGIRRDSFYVIRHTYMPSILVECGYISNPTEAMLLSNSNFRQRCATGIFKGIMTYAHANNMTTPNLSKTNKNSSKTQQIAQKKLKKIEKEIKASEPVGNTEYNER